MVAVAGKRTPAARFTKQTKAPTGSVEAAAISRSFASDDEGHHVVMRMFPRLPYAWNGS